MANGLSDEQREDIRRLTAANGLFERGVMLDKNSDVGLVIGFAVWGVGLLIWEVSIMAAGVVVIWSSLAVGWYSLWLLKRSLRMLRTGR